jgi:hypothetical protein
LTDPLSLAKYPYVHGNPVNLTDPSGLFVFGGGSSSELAVASKISAILKAIYSASPLIIRAIGQTAGTVVKLAKLLSSAI